MPKSDKYSRLTIEPCKSDPMQVVVYGWDEYPAHSVLAGQARKNFLGAFYSEHEAKQEFPDAAPSNDWANPQNTFDHL